MSERTRTRSSSRTPGTGFGRLSTSSVQAIVDSRRKRRSFWQQLALIGPAFVAGAWQFGPGNLATAVQAGSGYQYTLIWVIVVSTILMIFLTDMSVRLGIVSPVSLIQSIKDHLGKTVGVVAGFGVFLVTLCFSVGNAVGVGLGASMLFGGSPVMWTIICTLLVASILLVKNVYRVIEKVLIAMVAIMAIAFVTTAFIANPDWAAAASGLVPSVPSDAWLLVIALVGTNFSINAAFYTSYGTKERARSAADYRDITMVDTIPGIVAPGIMTALVIVVAASVIGATGQAATTMAQLGSIFEPLAGPVGTAIFAIGFTGAAFSAMIANSTAGGTMLSDALNRRGEGMRTSGTQKLISGGILAFGLIITVLFQAAPVQLIVTAQALTILVAPLLAALIVIMANRKSLMGALRNRWWQNLFGAIGLLAVLGLSLRLISNFVLGG
ncbi:NRAMP (natural resistance-associated macrophage protein) metal ion transporters [Agreia bicolorata]|uniref:NRAMP (Natural resistance-associated macrophage protein) metal ion transporters n=1 Tax=Agreia bicolorata TaxID=110935 RepID=A0A1T4YLL2_9MICO|nr:Nramp family divalent metal transporter [Agreia bicolorata]SKB02590.1 NRAMP (natural resistance-associated macrophage protein) metal ion transporters [Agreia bicolorata]